MEMALCLQKLIEYSCIWHDIQPMLTSKRTKNQKLHLCDRILTVNQLHIQFFELSLDNTTDIYKKRKYFKKTTKISLTFPFPFFTNYLRLKIIFLSISNEQHYLKNPFVLKQITILFYNMHSLSCFYLFTSMTN